MPTWSECAPGLRSLIQLAADGDPDAQLLANEELMGCGVPEQDAVDEVTDEIRRIRSTEFFIPRLWWQPDATWHLSWFVLFPEMPADTLSPHECMGFGDTGGFSSYSPNLVFRERSRPHHAFWAALHDPTVVLDRDATYAVHAAGLTTMTGFSAILREFTEQYRQAVLIPRHRFSQAMHARRLRRHKLMLRGVSK